MKPYILVVDDEPEIRNTVSEILEDEGFEVESAEDGASARSACQNRRPDLILLDIWMPDVDGITLLKEWSSEEDAESLPIIMMSGHGTVETAVEATRLGAYDFLEKPLSLAKLLLTLNNALKSSRLKQENLSLQQERQTTITEPTGKSQRLADVKSNAERIAQHPMPVLIQGESGLERSFLPVLYINTAHRRAAPLSSSQPDLSPQRIPTPNFLVVNPMGRSTTDGWSRPIRAPCF